ncbi:DUF3570 domain-containing protein [Methyloglobulus sp.]|uniref:DUF3570 domain-containing protein n=1 Tax=Methyloglobulus sp. TaxID=2518622 RepID=UPI0032B736D9
MAILTTGTSTEVKDTLCRFTAAAAVLPGLCAAPCLAAEGDEVDFQYSHYQEGKREITSEGLGDVLKGDKNPNPIEVESLHGHAKVSLSDRVKFAFNYVQDTWSGATPIATSPAIFGFNHALSSPDGKVLSGSSPYIQGQDFERILLDNKKNIYHRDDLTGIDSLTNSLSHIIATASPETRKQGDFQLSYNWDNAAISLGGGISIEDDYESRFGNLGGRWDFNQKRTSLNLGLSYTNSQTNAILDHDALPYIEDDSYFFNHTNRRKNTEDPIIISGIRQDWTTTLGISHVLTEDTLLAADAGYTRSTGYQSNPYKLTEIIFVNPDDFQSGDLVNPNYVGGFLERRPEVRNQWNVGGRVVQYIQPLDAALHFDYKFSADDWGIETHAFTADWVQPVGSGWTITPRLRYYSQDAADFYTPYLVTDQAYSKDVVDADGNNIYAGSDGKDYTEQFDITTLTSVFQDTQGNIKPESVEVTQKKIPYDAKKLPPHFSSDQRLSGFGTLSGGVTIEKKFAKGLSLETGFEYYTHQGSLKIGGGGEGSYADYDYWVANAALKVDLDTLSKGMMQAMGGMDHSAHAGHDMSKMDHSGHDMAQMDHSAHAGHGGHHHGAAAPAGVMSSHMLAKAGDWMIGYRFQWSNQSGALRNGTRPVSDREFIAKGCPGGVCALAPDSMPMSMHMLDLMYAPTDWLTLMLMPQWMDMNMKMRKLEGVPPYDDNVPSSHISHHAQNAHESGGFGDLGMYALFKLYDDSTHHLHITPGFTAPIGDVDLHLRRGHQSDGGFMHYCMQLGSGTWDFAPNLTYTGHLDDWSWGAQLNGVVRMGNKNKSGYRLGDIFQATAWGGYNITPWLTATLRGVYTTQGSIRGQYSGSEGGQFITGTDKDGNLIYSSILKFGSMDYPSNYGGRFGDVGFGLSAMFHSGSLAGNHFSVEWLQPVYNDMNGYQQNRDGTLNATWGIMF